MGGTKSKSMMQGIRHDIHLTTSIQAEVIARHIPGKCNMLADVLSCQDKIITTEWSLHPAAFWIIEQQWEWPQIDLSATSLNNQLPVYISPLPEPTAFAVDALSTDWTGMIAYAFPPMVLIPQVLLKYSWYI